VLAYNADPATPEHDAVALLDLLGQEPAARTAPRATSTDAASSPS
jgi:hypothetical protein